MGQEKVNDSWFSSWKCHSWKVAPETEKEVIGVLVYEVVSLMSKIVNLWHFLSEKEMRKSREEILRSVGVRKLVYDDDRYLMDLALNEIMENFGLISRAVGRLARKCEDHVFARFEHLFSDPIENGLEWFGWNYRLKKMDRKVKKMERFIAATIQLTQEIEVLAELEQTLKRMQANPDVDRVTLVEFQQKVMWQHQEVTNLRELSPWVKTHDYVVRLLARSLLAILEKIKLIFESNQLASAYGAEDHGDINPDCLPWTQSLTVIHPSESILGGISSGAHGKSDSRPGFTDNETIHCKQPQLRHQPSVLLGKLVHSKSKRLSSFGPFTGCIMSGSDSPVLESCKPPVAGSMSFTGAFLKMEKPDIVSLSCSNKICLKLAIFNSKPGLLNAPPSTLGHAALALHYACVIVTIEKLASSRHLIDFETRDNLYNMLPRNIRAALKARLKSKGKLLPPSAYKTSVAAKWNQYLSRTMEWLSPLAHNMIRWQSERNFKDQEFSGVNVLLVQTLYFADQAKTEAVITELLFGLNYIYWANKEHNNKASPEFSDCKASQGNIEKRYELGIECNKLLWAS